jgi:hypothetical protein
MAKDIYIITLLLLHHHHNHHCHGAEPFLRRCQSRTYTKISQNFMEPEVSLPYSQEHYICPNPEPD